MSKRLESYGSFALKLQGFEMAREIVDEENDEIESQQLEVKSSVDEAWYDATFEVLDDVVRVRLVGFGDEEDEIWDVNYLRKQVGNISNRIRLASLQLQDADCPSVVKDLVVCARHVSPDTDYSEEDGVVEEVKYFDAMITKVLRIPHTVRLGEEYCGCIFEAHWITGPDKKIPGSDNSVLLSCGDICTLHPGNVELHPVVKRIVRLLDRKIHKRAN